MIKLFIIFFQEYQTQCNLNYGDLCAYFFKVALRGGVE